MGRVGLEAVAQFSAHPREAAGLHHEIAQVLLLTFRPRMDLYAVRFDDAHSVAGINTWMRERGEHREFRIGDWKPAGPRHARHALTIDAVAEHVAGRRTVGFYPLHPDGTANSISVDLDSHRGARTTEGNPFADLEALITVCLRRGVRFLANVSRGGSGAWLHVLPPRNTPAWRGRAIVSALVREAGIKHVTNGGTFDDLCPKQSDLRTANTATPGNLFCVPLCGRWLRAEKPGTHLYNASPTDIREQLRALTEY